MSTAHIEALGVALSDARAALASNDHGAVSAALARAETIRLQLGGGIVAAEDGKGPPDPPPLPKVKP